MHISTLIIEGTRQCNMTCEHCLRGAPQRKKMSYETLSNALKHVTYINCVTFTGGEPTLNSEIVDQFIELIRDYNITVEYFYVVSNGKTNRVYIRKFLKSLDKLYSMCYEKDMCVLCISQDQFHSFEKSFLWKFEDECGGSPEYFHPEQRKGYIDYSVIINQGRAEENGLGVRNLDHQDFLLIGSEEDGLEDLSVDMVYVSANGNVQSQCDFAFSYIDTNNFGNVNETSLVEIVKSAYKFES